MGDAINLLIGEKLEQSDGKGPIEWTAKLLNLTSVDFLFSRSILTIRTMASIQLPYKNYAKHLLKNTTE